jgi:branched-chain amino acid transport system substrate-binding protein
MKKLCLAIGFCFLLFSVLPVGAAEVVKIGKPGATSGGAAKTGIQEIEGSTLAVEDLNAKGGVNGVKFELIVTDGKCSPLDATYAAERMVMQDKVHVFLDALCSSATLAIFPILEREKIAMVVEESSADAVTEKKNPYVFRTCPNNSQIAGLLVNAIVQSKVKKLAFLFEQTDWGRGGAEALTKLVVKEGIAVESIAVDRGLSNFLPIISSMKSKNVDAVCILMLIPQGVQFLKQSQETGFKAQWFGFQQMMSANMYEQAGSTADGLIGHDPFRVTEAIPASIAFAKSYRKKYGREPSHYAAHGYQSTMLIAEAVKIGGPTREGILKGLQQIKDFQTVTGVINFDDHQQVIIEGRPGFVVKWWQGKKVVVK